ncbi:MAG: hypothetical protein ACUVXJ_11795 [Phycisphaerae bacterium]
MNETSLNVSLPTVSIRPRRRRWVSILLSFLLLFSGMVIGSGATLIIVQRVVQHRMRHPEQLPGRAAARLRKPLGLSDEQVTRIRSILRERLARLQALRREWQPQLEAELDGIEKDVAAALQPEQAEKWRRIARDKREQWLPLLPPVAETQPNEGQ